MDNSHKTDKDLHTINPMASSKNDNPPNIPPGMKASSGTIKTTSENPEYLLLSQGIHPKESPNTKKKRAPSPTHIPSDLLPRFTDPYFVSNSNISRPAVPRLPPNKAYMYNLPRYISEAPISSPQRPHPRFAALHNPTADPSQYPVSYPNSSRNTGSGPPGYISADPIVEYMSGAQTPLPGRPHPHFAAVRGPIVVARQYPANSYPSSFSYTGNSLLRDMPIANISPAERFRPSIAAIYNPATDASQYPVNSYNSPRNSSYSPHSHMLRVPTPPLPHYNTPHSPTAVTPQYPVSNCQSSHGNSPPERPRPHFATPHNPAAGAPQCPVSGSYLNGFRNTGNHEPISHRHVAASKLNITIAMSFQIISTRWVRTECARKMAAKLNEIEERHAEGAQRFSALMESLEKNTLAGSRDNNQLDANSTDSKLQKTQDPAPTMEARLAANTSLAPETLVSRFGSNSRADWNDSYNEDYLAALCSIC